MDVLTVKRLVQDSYAMAVDKGFWDGPFNVSEKLMLIVSELSEAQEEARNSKSPNLSDKMCYYGENLKPEGFAVELADAVIRIADLCGRLDIDLSAVIREKMAFNATRPHRHGRNF